MDLSQITKNIQNTLNPVKELNIGGMVFSIKVPTFEHQAILDFLAEEASKENHDSALDEEYIRKTIAYSLVAVNGEDLTAPIDDLLEELRKWPQSLVNMLSAAVTNYRMEVAAKMSADMDYAWFNIKDFALQQEAKEAAKSGEAPNTVTAK